MKTFLLFLAIALTCYGFNLGHHNQNLHHPHTSSFLAKSESESEQTQDYSPVDVSDLETSTDLQNHLNFGVQQLLQILVNSGKISSDSVSAFSVSKVTDIQKQPLGKASNFKFQVELTNNQGTTIKATFAITYKPTGERTFGAYSYSMTIKKTVTKVSEPNESAWITVSLDEFQSSTSMSAALEYAIENSIKQATSKGELVIDGTLQIVKLNTISKQTVGDYRFYKFDVDLTNNKGTSITLSCTVAENAKTGERILRFYHYIATTTLYAERIKVVNTNEGYVTVTQTELQSVEIQNCLKYGVQQIITLIIGEGKWSKTDFTITKTTTCLKRVVGTWIFYKFEVVLQNSEGVTITCSFTVRYSSTTKSMDIAGFTYKYNGGQSTDGDDTNEGQYIVEDSSDDDESKDAIDYGCSEIIKKATQAGKITSTTFKITRVLNVYKKVTSKGIFYKFNCELEDDEGATMTVSCTVKYNVKNGNTEVKSYSYNVKSASKDAGEYTDVSINDVTSESTFQTGISFAVKEIVDKVVKKNNLSDREFSISKYTSIQRSVTKAYTFYRCTIVLSNKSGGTITATFTVRVHIKTGACELTSFNYNYSYKKVTTSTDESDYEESDTEEETGDYTDVESDDIDNDVKTCADYGISEIIKKVLQKKTIENTDFTISKITSIKKKVTSKWISCIFEIELYNGEGWTITTKFTVRCNKKTGACSLQSYNYKSNYDSKWLESIKYVDVDVSKAGSDSQLQTALKYAVTEIVSKYATKSKSTKLNFSVSKYNSIQRKVTSTYVYYNFDVELTNGAGTTIYTTFSVKCQVKTGKCELTSFNYRYTTKKVTSEDESDYEEDSDTDDDGDYSDVAESGLKSDSDVKTCAEYGVSEIIKKVLKKKTIENTDFSITKITSIKKKVSGQWVTCKFEVELTNGEGWTITTKFTVKCNKKTGSCSLKAYNYKYNYNSSWSDSIKYVDVDTSKAGSDSQLQTALKFGINEIADKLKSKVTKNSFTLSKYNSVQKKTTTTYIFYNFDVELTNGAGTTVYATFSVKYQVKTAKCELTSFSYKYTTKKVSTEDESDFTDYDEEEGTYTTVDSSQVTSNTDVKTCVNYGINEISKKVGTKKGIKNTSFTISKVSSVQKKTTMKWTYYKFELVLENGDGWTVTTTFTTRYNAKTGDCVLKSYKYKIEYKEPAAQKITSTDIDKNADLKAAMEYGVSEVTNKLKTQGVISSLNFKVTKVEEGQVKKTKDGTYYTFNLELTGPSNFVVKISITVFQNAKTGARSISSWSLKGTSIGSAISSAVSSIGSWIKSAW